MFVEHVMRAVLALTDRLVVLNHGELLAEGPAAQVMQRPERDGRRTSAERRHA